MEHRAKSGRSESERIDTGSAEAFSESGSVADVDEDDVRLDRLQIDGEAVEIRGRLGESASVDMIIRETFAIVLERVEGTCRDDPRLAEPAPVHLLEPAPAIDYIAGSGERRPHRGAETFREAHVHRRCGVGVLVQADAGGSRRVPEPSAVEVDGEAEIDRHVAYRAHRLESPDRSTRFVVGVLHRDECCWIEESRREFG